MTPAWRPMRPADLTAVAVLADQVHIEHPEAPAVFAERLRLFPAGCFTLADGPAMMGYALAHPGRLGEPPPLDTLLGSLPEAADCLYLHDIALAPAATRQGYGADLVARLIELSAEYGFASVALVAVRASGPFWRRLGFHPVEVPSLRAKLASYGNDAAYMSRSVAKAKMPDGL